MDENSIGKETAYPQEKFLGDLSGLARESPDTNPFKRQADHVALRPLMMLLEDKRRYSRKGAKMDENSISKETVYPKEKFLGDLSGLAREKPDTNPFKRQADHDALRPLVLFL